MLKCCVRRRINHASVYSSSRHCSRRLSLSEEPAPYGHIPSGHAPDRCHTRTCCSLVGLMTRGYGGRGYIGPCMAMAMGSCFAQSGILTYTESAHRPPHARCQLPPISNLCSMPTPYMMYMTCKMFHSQCMHASMYAHLPSSSAPCTMLVQLQ